MKPIVEFIRLTTILKQISVVQKKVEGQSVNFDNKQDIVDTINLIPPPTGWDTVMYVKCGCGREYIYTTMDDIPAINTDCVCGQKLIEYGT